MLYRIIKKNQNKIFWTIGQFEFEYFGGSDVVNKLYVWLGSVEIWSIGGRSKFHVRDVNSQSQF